jgi:ribokinase
VTGSGAPRVGVVGHVEWVEFAVVDHVPARGEILHAREWFAAPGGGGAVAAVQLRKLAGTAMFLTVVGSDEFGRQAARELRDEHGVDLHCVVRPAPQRRGFTYLDDEAERTITILGERLVPSGDDPLPWNALADLDGVYFTGGDAAALRAARRARVLVATPRALDTIERAGVRLDVLVASASDPGETIPAGRVDPAPAHVVLTRGAAGGTWVGADQREGAWAAAPLPGPPVDSYGCGDSFAAGLTYALAAGLPLDEALTLAARCGAHCLTGRGPYSAQLALA